MRTHIALFILTSCSGVPCAGTITVPHGMGSCGAAVLNDHQIVTAAHCANIGISGCAVERLDTQNDIAWLYCGESLGRPRAVVRIPVDGENVIVHAKPSTGGCRTEVPARVLRILGGTFEVSGEWISGDSGSPVYGEDGALLGVLTKAYRTGGIAATVAN